MTRNSNLIFGKTTVGNAATKVSETVQKVTGVIFVANSGNSGATTIGDGTNGIPVAAGGGISFEACDLKDLILTATSGNIIHWAATL